MKKLLAIILGSATCVAATARTLHVGPDQRYGRIEDANAKARPGDVILVHPRPNNAPYQRVAVFVRQKNLTFKAVPAKDQNWVQLSGNGFDFSGQGSTPRAIFQFNKGTDNCLLEGFELFDAHNRSHNGAGVRINQANNITVRNCSIHNNDMGIMSNGDSTADTAVNQLIEHCVLHHNGSPEEPGYNHNLYLGGTSATLKFCEIHSSLTGHNIKSRAHQTRVLYSYVHDSANREFDLVDAKDTGRVDSHAVLMGNVIVKDPKCKGNRGVIHFGQDGGGEHDGTIFLVHNTIVTPHISAVVVLSSEKAKGVLIGNLISDGGVKRPGQRVAGGERQGNPANVSGTHNWLDRGFADEGETSLSVRENSFGRHTANLFPNATKGDYRPATPLETGSRLEDIQLPPFPGEEGKPELPLTWEYSHPAGKEKRLKESQPTPGAYAGQRTPSSEPLPGE